MRLTVTDAEGLSFSSRLAGLELKEPKLLKNELLRETPAGVGRREVGTTDTTELDESGSVVVRRR